ncbi:hypothetical protein B0H14DRAFT_2591363 [Mycena olivaceomarginata]|nr:hypothetical protein B0H14DRAFT_2591363 [Mycena olivaceomarginata]
MELGAQVHHSGSDESEPHSKHTSEQPLREEVCGPTAAKRVMIVWAPGLNGRIRLSQLGNFGAVVVRNLQAPMRSGEWKRAVHRERRSPETQGCRSAARSPNGGGCAAPPVRLVVVGDCALAAYTVRWRWQREGDTGRRWTAIAARVAFAAVVRLVFEDARRPRVDGGGTAKAAMYYAWRRCGRTATHRRRGVPEGGGGEGLRWDKMGTAL